MTTAILPRAKVIDMSNQLKALGATLVKSDTGYVVTAPNGKEVLRAMIGTSGQFLTRWPTGLFDVA